MAEHDFAKLAEHVGSTPRIKDNPPLIFHAPEQKEDEDSGNIKEAWALYHESLPEHVRVLFDRFHLCDMAMKVVGVGSVATACLVALFMAADDDPLFLQIKEANPSVLEPYAGKSLHSHHGQRVVVGQRLMQSASDSFLGWTQGRRWRHFYVRQLRDMKLSALYIGPARIGDIPTDHYAFRQEGVDWQIWIEKGKTLLPRKLVLTTTDEEGQPQYVSVMKWNLSPSIRDKMFTFVPPKDAHRIVFVGQAANATK